MGSWQRRLARRAVVLLVLGIVAGCGGSDASSGPGTPGGGGGLDDALPGGSLTRGEATARFHVDVTTGEVTITPLTRRTAFAGNAVEFRSSVLLDQPGDAGRRVLNVYLRNNTGEVLGQGVGAGLVDGVRCIIGPIVSGVTPTTSVAAKSRVETVAGDGTAGHVNGLPGLGRFDTPLGVCTDRDGVTYITEYGGHRVRRLAGGMLSDYVGDGTAGSTNGVGANARLNTPAGIAWYGGDDALYVTEFTAHRIRRIDEHGRASTIAGDGTTGDADGTGDVARFRNPLGICVAEGGAVYVAESGGHRIRRLLLTGTDPRRADHWTVATIAGNGTAGMADAAGASARFNTPAGLTVGPDRELYVADRANHRVRRCTLQGDVTTVAGTGVAGWADGVGSLARFQDPYGIGWLGQALVVTERDGQRVRLLLPRADGAAAAFAENWLVRHVAGAGAGDLDGPGDLALLNRPRLIAPDDDGALLLAESDNHKLRRVIIPGSAFTEGIGGPIVPADPVRLAEYTGVVPRITGDHLPFILAPGTIAAGSSSITMPWAFTVPAGTGVFEFDVAVESPTSTPAPTPASLGVGSDNVWVRTYAGSAGGAEGYLNGPAVSALFDSAVGLAWGDNYDILYVADRDNNAIRYVDPLGRVGTMAGVPGQSSGFADGTGRTAQLDSPTGVALSPDGTYLFFCDRDNDAVRVIHPVGADEDAASRTVTTIAGTGVAGYANGLGGATQFTSPVGLCMDAGRNLYVTEDAGNRVRLLKYLGGDLDDADSWRSYLVAGSTTGTSGNTDGSGSSARFLSPNGIAVAPNGDLYVADSDNHRIRRITNPGGPTGGTVTTFAGSTPGYLDETGTAAQFMTPVQLVCDSTGTLFVADRSNNRIRRISPSGVVRTVAGGAGSVDGNGHVALFNGPYGIALNPAGDLYVSDGTGGPGRIRLIQRLIDHASG